MASSNVWPPADESRFSEFVDVRHESAPAWLVDQERITEASGRRPKVGESHVKDWAELPCVPRTNAVSGQTTRHAHGVQGENFQATVSVATTPRDVLEQLG
jgi:hypothetical protein